MNDDMNSAARALDSDKAPDTLSARVGIALRSPLAWLGLLLVYVLFSRLWGLSAKVMHHDESLFAYYGYWLFRGNGYDYQPILHGPVLQWLSAFFFFLFGDDQWTMRIPSMLGGLLMFPVAWYWRRYLGGVAGAVAVTGLIALSPSIGFYARFLRNDVPYLTATMWTALCLVRALQTARPKYVWGAIMGATLMFCMMESSIFFFAACIGYLVTMVLVDLLIWRKDKSDLKGNNYWSKLTSSRPQPRTSGAKFRFEPVKVILVLCAVLLFGFLNLSVRVLETRYGMAVVVAYVTVLAALAFFQKRILSAIIALRWTQRIISRSQRWTTYSKIRPRVTDAPPVNASALRRSDYFYCAVAAILLTTAAGWLFHRVFYATLHIYKPVQALLPNILSAVPPQALNGLITAAAFMAMYIVILIVSLTVRRRSGGNINGMLSRSVWLKWPSIVMVAMVGWLFHRFLYYRLHYSGPISELPDRVLFNISPQAANYVIATATLVGIYLLSLLILANFRRPSGRYGFAGWFSRTVWLNRWHVVAAVAVAVIIYTTIFTTLFTNTRAVSFDHQLRDFRGPEMALTPVQIYKNTWDYWWDQHKLHRIKGPFHYYLPILLLYELPIIGLALLGWLRALRNTRRPWLHGAALAAMHVLLGLIIWIIPPIDWEKMDKLFHLTHPAHLFLILFYAQLLVYIAPMLFRQGRRAESFITYWGVTSLFAYSYAGEKVPWLTVHTVGPMALLAAGELVRLASAVKLYRNNEHGRDAYATSDGAAYATTWRRTVFLIIAGAAVLYQVRNNHLLLFVHPWSPAERLVYNHTSPDIQKAVAMIDDIGQKTNFGNKLPVLMQGEMGWPLHWYLREYNNIIAPVGESAENTTRPVVMVDWQVAGVQNLRDNYTIRRMKVREWWEPEMLDLSSMADLYLVLTPLESRDSGVGADRYRRSKQEWAKLWRYLAYREIWIDPNNSGWSNGTNEFAFCVKKDIDERLMQYEWLAVTPKRPDVPVFIPY